MINAVIFDLDGVLVSTDEFHFKAWQRLANELGIDGFTEKDNLRQRGVSRMESLEVVLEKTSRSFSEDEKKELAARKNGYYVESLEELDEKAILPGAVDTLNRLRARGVKIAVGSSSRNAGLILEKCGLMPYIDKLADGNDAKNSKPAPDVFLAAAEKLGMAPGECLVVEDAAAGIEAACRAGMVSLGVGPAAGDENATWGAPGLDSTAADWDAMLA